MMDAKEGYEEKFRCCNVDALSYRIRLKYKIGFVPTQPGALEKHCAACIRREINHSIEEREYIWRGIS